MLLLVNQVVASQLAFIDGIGFDPFFRGLLSVLVGVVVLMGSTYLIVATNTGSRQGFLIAVAGLTGWMFLMGIIWTIYGIGWNGAAPTWSLVEINFDDAGDTDDGLLFSEVEEAAQLFQSDSGDGVPAGGLGEAPFDPEAVLDRYPDADARESVAGLLSDAATVDEIADQDVAQEAALVASRQLDLGDWRYLESSDPIRGEAQASVDAFLIEGGRFAAGEYVTRQFGAFTIDGKPVLVEDANVFERVGHFFNETFLHPFYGRELIVIQVQAAIEQPTLPGQPPPVATVDPDAPLVSVIMERDRGGPFPALFSGRRFTPAMFTIFNGLVFAAVAWNMHVRDQRESEIRTAA
ncbi:MAG: hypothetical protein ACFCVK_23355 [Acidimicrobiales bacterium]